MNLRAVIFDVYGTMLEVGPPPTEAAHLWETAWARLGTAPRLTLPQFEASCRAAVATHQDAARRRGIPFPEVFWPKIVNEVLPEVRELPAQSELRAFFHGVSFLHSVRLASGAAQTLAAACAAGLQLGLASNCQPYSVAELIGALRQERLAWEIFDPRIRFLSFENGFSKPDPHAFQLLRARLEILGIRPDETMMVGDREDNDIVPARACGWRTFQIQPGCADAWASLREQFQAQPTPCARAS